MGERIGIRGFNSFVNAGDNIQTLEINLGVVVKAKDFPAFQERFLKELQDFLKKKEVIHTVMY